MVLCIQCDVLENKSVQENVNVCISEQNHPTFLVHLFVQMSLGTNKAFQLPEVIYSHSGHCTH